MQRRREFLATSAGWGAGLAAGCAWPGMSARAAGAPAPSTELPGRLPPCPRAVIVVELAGGNDPFNTIVPRDEARYRAARPTLALPPSEILPVGPEAGWHAALAPLLELRERGELAVCPSVGFETGHPSHASAVERWREAFRSAGRPVEFPPVGLSWDEQWSRAIDRVAATSQPVTLGTTLAGFDTHTRQAELHPHLLAELAAGLREGWRALESRGLADEVRIVVVSEFGRSLSENAFGGTDHGPAGVALVLGARVGCADDGAPPGESAPRQTVGRFVQACCREDGPGFPAA